MDQINGQPSDVLKDEHAVILRVLAVFEKLLLNLTAGHTVDQAAVEKCIRFFRLFADQCHHAKEEDLFFPALEERGIPRDGGPIGVMVWEHRMARQLTQEMVDTLGEVQSGDREKFTVPAQKYIELLRDHIGKEDHCLFPMGDQVLGEADRRSLCQKFCDAQCRSFEGVGRDDLIKMADELEALQVGADASPRT